MSLAAHSNFAGSNLRSRGSDLHVGSRANAPSWRVFLWVLAAATVARLVLAAMMPPAEDEMYYWAWSQNLSMSYFDHPPLTAWLIRLSTTLFGNSPLAFRLPAVLLTSATVFFVALMSTSAGLTTLLMLTPLFFVGGVMMTPDIPLAFFWTVYLFWTVRIQTKLESWNCDPVTRVYHNSPISPMDWLAGGILLGAGLLSKYTMLLAAVCSLLTFFTRTAPRAWWKGYGLHVMIAGLLGLPVLVFNYYYDFAPFKFQWEHISMSGGFTWQRFFDFWGGQAALVGLLPLLFLPRILIQWKYLWNDPRIQPCIVFFVAPLSYFTYKSLTANLEANWGLVMYLAFFPIAQRICQISSFKAWNRMLVVLGFLPAWIAAGILAVHTVSPIAKIPPYKDRFRVSRARFDIAQLAAAEVKRAPLPTFLPGYYWTAFFRYFGVPAEQLAAGRPTHFTLKPVDPCQHASIYFWNGSTSEMPSELGCFSRKTVVKNYLVLVSGQELETIQLLKLEK